MGGTRFLALTLGVSVAIAASPAFAVCSGTPASQDAINAFTASPPTWLANETGASLSSDIQALGVSASGAPAGTPLAGFPGQVTTLLQGLGPRQAAQSSAIGTGLGVLGASCKTQDPAFNASLSAAVALSRNVAANDAFQKEDSDIASVGSGGGTGVGGGTGGNAPTGGANTSNTNVPSQSTPTPPVFGGTTLTTGTNSSTTVLSNSSSL